MERRESSLSNYEMISPLGRGAYSLVYKVKDRRTNEHFALKIIDKMKLNQQRLYKRLRNEVSLQSQLNHPCIVRLYDYFEDQENVYLLLELCSGGELFTYLKTEGKLSELETRTLISQLVDGISFMHSQNILHRDLKLGNLLLSENKTQLKIGDFGLAVKLTDFEEERSTLCGTPNYISPEVVSRKPYGLSSDLWSLGCIVYACLVGYPPFESPSVQETMVKLKDMQYALPEFLSTEAKELINSLLAWDPKDRINIQQVKNHPFIKGNIKKSISDYVGRGISPIPYIESDCSYYDYIENLKSPQPPRSQSRLEISRRTTRVSQGNCCTPTLSNSRRTHSIGNKENLPPSQEIKENAEAKITPLSTKNLPPIKHKLKNGELEIGEDGWVRVFIGKRKLEISGDGLTILYNGHMLRLKNMRRTPAKLYQLAVNFIEIVKTKTPKIKIQEKNAVCMLMRNTPFPNYEVDFDNGVRVTFQVGSENFTVYQLDGKEILVNPYEDLNHLNKDLSSIIEISMEGLKNCLAKERELSSSF
ncbi:unnamed protein product [Blepharisma stoltei]|uniref:non-specific serine/threonine protein kinase n=1 Tax=Blepharisma stoltei TaxID=1481888 RepID=A0AAU9IGY1_9CILI|nr:unnamed protein product [Blepharisma stoltei]